jgi:hypothetical protein
LVYEVACLRHQAFCELGCVKPEEKLEREGEPLGTLHGGGDGLIKMGEGGELLLKVLLFIIKEPENRKLITIFVCGEFRRV